LISLRLKPVLIRSRS